jgi:hypothetical protein
MDNRAVTIRRVEVRSDGSIIIEYDAPGLPGAVFGDGSNSEAMETPPNGNGSKKPPIHVPLEATLSPVGILAVARVQQRLRDRLVTGLRRFPKLPSWVHSAASTVPMIEYAVAGGFSLTFLVSIELAKSPWLLPAVLWSSLAAVVACSGHWLRDYYRITKPSYVTPAAAVSVVVVVICLVVGSYGPIQRIEPLLQTAVPSTLPSVTPTQVSHPKSPVRHIAPSVIVRPSATAVPEPTPTARLEVVYATPPRLAPTPVATQAYPISEKPTRTIASPVPSQQPPVVQIAPAGRHLTADQEGILRDQLASLRDHVIQVYANMGDSESQRFAQHLYTLFQGIGINVGNGIGQSVNSLPPPPLTVDCYTPLPANQNAVEVQDALALRGALIAASLLSDSSKIQVYPKNMFGKTHLTVLFVGAQTGTQ